MKVTVPATPSFPDSTQNHSAKKTCLKNAGVIVDTMDQLHEFISREVEKVLTAMEAHKSEVLEEIQKTPKTGPPNNIIVKKTPDLVSGIDDPVERRRYSRRLSAYLGRLYSGQTKLPRCIREVAKDGREYIVFFVVEEAEPKRKRKTIICF